MVKIQFYYVYITCGPLAPSHPNKIKGEPVQEERDKCTHLCQNERDITVQEEGKREDPQ